MSDWAGTQRLRRNPPTAGRFDGTRPLPAKMEYHVPAGTKALLKRVGGKWRYFRTQEDNTFDSAYRVSKNYILFFRVGWLLSVGREDVHIVPQKDAP